MENIGGGNLLQGRKYKEVSLMVELRLYTSGMRVRILHFLI